MAKRQHGHQHHVMDKGRLIMSTWVVQITVVTGTTSITVATGAVIPYNAAWSPAPQVGYYYEKDYDTNTDSISATNPGSF